MHSHFLAEGIGVSKSINEGLTLFNRMLNILVSNLFEAFKELFLLVMFIVRSVAESKVKISICSNALMCMQGSLNRVEIKQL